MAIVFNALFGSNQSKTAGTSLAINPTDITVAAGDDIFLAYAGDDGGSAFGVTDGGTASITWTLEKEQINAGNVKTQFWRGNVTAGGTLTDLTISWTTNVTAKAAVAGWFSGVGTLDGTSGVNSATAICTVVDDATIGWESGDLVVGGAGYEGPGTDALNLIDNGTLSDAEIGQNGTTGGGAASNIAVSLIYGIATATQDGTDVRVNNATNAQDNAGAGAVYSPAAAAAPGPSGPQPRKSQRALLLRRM